MKYISEFRDPERASALVQSITALACGELAKRDVRIMEVCGTHTMAIGRFGIRSLLPRNIDLLSGPGCPVCVTDSGYIDCAIELARSGASVVTFGDLLKVPGSNSTLADCRAEGGVVHVCLSPLEAIERAKAEPDRQVVFLGIGFETTTAPVLSVIPYAQRAGLKNLSLLCAFKLVPPALEILARDPDLRIDAFLAPAHVSAIIGSNAYLPFTSEFHRPVVVAGFEPLDILLGLQQILAQVARGVGEVENTYSRVVRPEGNIKAQGILSKYTESYDAPWRGLGVLPKSGLRLRQQYQEFDAEVKLGVVVKEGKVRPGCRCGEVLKGAIKPYECKLFGHVCSPANPLGPCMVSSEGTCAAYLRFSGVPA